MTTDRMNLVGKVKLVKTRIARKQKVVRVTIDFSASEITEDELRDLKAFMKLDKDAKIEIIFVEENQALLTEFGDVE